MTVAFAAVAFAWRTVRHSKAEVPAPSSRVAARPPAPPMPPEAPSTGVPEPAPQPAAAAAPPAIDAARDGAKKGWLRVGGTALLGGRVTADGDFAGYAPLELSLPVGAHVVIVTSKTGHVLVRKRLHISEDQTRLTPLRILR
jgi:hypothetical protein